MRQYLGAPDGETATDTVRDAASEGEGEEDTLELLDPDGEPLEDGVMDGEEDALGLLVGETVADSVAPETCGSCTSSSGSDKPRSTGPRTPTASGAVTPPEASASSTPANAIMRHEGLGIIWKCLEAPP